MSEERIRAPARTVEARETQLISLAMDVAEEQLRNRTASSQVITHYLKLGAVREQLELEKVRAEIELSKAKVKAIEAGEETEKRYQEVIDAFRRYTIGSAFDSSNEEEYVDD